MGMTLFRISLVYCVMIERYLSQWVAALGDPVSTNAGHAITTLYSVLELR